MNQVSYWWNWTNPYPNPWSSQTSTSKPVYFWPAYQQLYWLPPHSFVFILELHTGLTGKITLTAVMNSFTQYCTSKHLTWMGIRRPTTTILFHYLPFFWGGPGGPGCGQARLVKHSSRWGGTVPGGSPLAEWYPRVHCKWQGSVLLQHGG